MSYYTIITILFFHWLFDFYFQTDEMAKNKSKCTDALMSHVAVYSIGLLFMLVLNGMFFLSDSVGTFLMSMGMVGFVVINTIAHFVTDWVTSRATSALYKEERYHDFFVVIGVDQMIHYITLFGTFIWLTNL
jgi:hypothetical protein